MRGVEPYVRLVGLLLVALALVLVFGVVVADLLLVASWTLFAVGGVLAVVPGLVVAVVGTLVA